MKWRSKSQAMTLLHRPRPNYIRVKFPCLSRRLKLLVPLLLFCIITFKLNLDLQLLSSSSTLPYAHWWTNEAAGFLRQQRAYSSNGSGAVGIENENNVYKQKRYNKTQGGPSNGSDLGKDFEWRGAYSYGNRSLTGQNRPHQVKSSFKVVKEVFHSFKKTQNVKADEVFSDLLQENMRVDLIRNSIFAMATNRTAAPVKIFPRSKSSPTLRKLIPEPDLNKASAQTTVQVKGLSHEDRKEVFLGVKEILKIRPQIEKLNEAQKILNPEPDFNRASARTTVQVKGKGLSHEDRQEVFLGVEEILKIRRQIEKLNEAQKILNLESYGPVQPNTTILLVQVHNRLENLRFLVESFTKTRYINETLVIFSHDLWDDDINAFVSNISAFRAMQIFFPFSIQLHPYAFPGRDPRDCKGNFNSTINATLDCLNREWPDRYGNYREPRLCQIKHHWWWKIHRVFEGLRVTGPNFEGEVIFLEEDHYVAPDLLHIHRLLKRIRDQQCPECLVLSLGNYKKLTPFLAYADTKYWDIPQHNLGFVLNAKAWKSIKNCSQIFCEFDDYNWDWTLYYMTQKCIEPRLKSLAIRNSRVYHVGMCGTHVKKKKCDVRRVVLSIIRRLTFWKRWLFPKALRVAPITRSNKTTRGFGGWGDYRDQQFCKDIATKEASEESLKKLQFLDPT